MLFFFSLATRESFFLLKKTYLPFICSVYYLMWPCRVALLEDKQGRTPLGIQIRKVYPHAVRGECSPRHFMCFHKGHSSCWLDATLGSPENPVVFQEVLTTPLPASQPDKYSVLRNVGFNPLSLL